MCLWVLIACYLFLTADYQYYTYPDQDKTAEIFLKKLEETLKECSTVLKSEELQEPPNERASITKPTLLFCQNKDIESETFSSDEGEDECLKCFDADQQFKSVWQHKKDPVMTLLITICLVLEERFPTFSSFFTISDEVVFPQTSIFVNVPNLVQN